MAPRSDIESFHDEVDALTARLEELHRDRLQCSKGCAGCCVDDISVFEIEADLIRRKHADVLQTAPHPEGACAFLDDEGACRIYASRPYVCRTQGLPIRWVDEVDGQPVEYRDICELNEEGPLITSLEPQACWPIGPAEAKLQALQAQHGEPMARVKLRDLFQKPSTMRNGAQSK